MAIYQGKTKLTSFSSGLTDISTEIYKGEYSIVPAAQQQTLQTKNTYLSSDLKVIEDKQLLPENIKEGIELFGVTGTATSGFTPNGTEWTWATNKSFYEIKYGNGVFVGCCTDGWIYYSSNGIDWHQNNLQLPVEDGIYPEIIYDNETWVVNDAANLNCYISKDNGQIFSKVDDISSIFTVVKNGIIIFGNGSVIQRASIKTLSVTTQLEGISNPLIATDNNNNWIVGDKSGGGVYYSTDDGVTWTVSNLTSENICTLKYCNNIWIASFQDSGVYWSIDGITWTQSNLTTGIVGDVAFYNNKWHIIGYSIEDSKNASWYSLNGKQWYPNSNNATSQLSDNSISISNSIYCNSNIMITGGLKDLYQGVNRKTYILRSLTGANWKLSEQNNNNVLQVYTLEHGKNIWIASNLSGTYYSLTWGEIPVDEFFVGLSWYSTDVTTGSFEKVINYNGSFIACSNSEEGLWYSEDGVTWQQSNITTGSFRCVYNSGDLLLAGGMTGEGLYYSHDGQSWELIKAMLGSWRCMYYVNGIFVVGSAANLGLYYSTDGITYNETNITSGRFSDILYANGMWIAASYGGNGLYYSIDGITWSSSSNTIGYFNALYYNNNLWLAGSNDNSGIWYSTDNGKNWTTCSNTGSHNFKSICLANNIYVASSNSNGGIWYSTDGINWKQSNITVGYFKQVYYANGVWAAIGYASTEGIYWSQNGKKWVISNVVTGEYESICYNSTIDAWVAVGSNDNGIYSTSSSGGVLS